MEDIFSNKAVALSHRYRILPVESKVSSIEDLHNFDLVVSCVDNSTLRRMLFENYYVLEDFLDLRSEGKSYAAYSKCGNSQQKLINTLPKKDIENGSCQLLSDKRVGHIQQGNKIIAYIGSQFILDKYRGINTSLSLVQTL